MRRFCSSSLQSVPQPRVRQVLELRGDPRGHLAHHREHRALRGGAHGLVGALGGPRHRRADHDRVDELARARHELLRGAADELGQDDPGVAARAEQRRAGEGVHELVAADVVDGAAVAGQQHVDLLQDGPEGERHVVPGVAVGDGEHVQVVDLLAARLEVDERAADDLPEPDERGIRHGCAGATRVRRP
jgi:hypothetical protein